MKQIKHIIFAAIGLLTLLVIGIATLIEHKEEANNK